MIDELLLKEIRDTLATNETMEKEAPFRCLPEGCIDWQKLKAQRILAKVKQHYEQKDRPDREKIRGKLKDMLCQWQCDECEHANGIAEDGCRNPLFDKLIALFPDKAPEGLLEATIQVRCEEAKREIIEEIDPYIKQVVDCDKHDKGYSLVDPVGLAALDYWWKAIKETNGR